MSGVDAQSCVFFDTNILLYLLSENDKKSDCSETLISRGGIISAQVLNEFASVASKNLRMEYADIREILDSLRSICTVVPLSLETHNMGIDIAERYGFAFYDSLIVASALQSDCSILYTENLQNNQIIEKQLTLINPFIS